MFRKEDGVPAVWLTFTNWLAIKDGLVSEYLGRREYMGRREARIAAGLRREFPDYGGHFDTTACEAALELYRVGYKAHRRIHEQSGCHDLTPEKLIELGNRHEQREQEAETKRLAERAANAGQAASPTAEGKDGAR
jgi:hypothetical protein